MRTRRAGISEGTAWRSVKFITRQQLRKFTKPMSRAQFDEKCWLGQIVAVAKPIQEHLFDGLIIGHHYVANGVAADEVAHFLRQVLGVISGALERLGHKNNLQTGLAL